MFVKKAGLKKGISRSRRGAAALEFGLVCPLLIVLVTAITEIGYSMFQAIQISAAAEAGVMYAISAGKDQAGTVSAVQNATSLSNVSVNVTFTCGCSSASGVTYTSDCVHRCSGAGAYLVGTYIIVKASAGRQSLLGLPWLPLPSTLSAQGMFRRS